jgi:hypothetical protein
MVICNTHTAHPTPTHMPLGQRNSATLMHKKTAKKQARPPGRTCLKETGPPCFPRLRPLFFVTFFVCISVCSVAATSGFLKGSQKPHPLKTLPLLILCAPARPGQLRVCHLFCASMPFTFSPKKAAKPLRKRTAANPIKKWGFFSAAWPGQCAKGRCWAPGSATGKPPQTHAAQAFPLSGPIGREWPSHNCGLPFQKMSTWL